MTKRRALAILKLFDDSMIVNDEFVSTKWYALAKLLEVAERDAKLTLTAELLQKETAK